MYRSGASTEGNVEVWQSDDLAVFTLWYVSRIRRMKGLHLPYQDGIILQQ